jgi:hypothetical protein
MPRYLAHILTALSTLLLGALLAFDPSPAGAPDPRVQEHQVDAVDPVRHERATPENQTEEHPAIYRCGLNARVRVALPERSTAGYPLLGGVCTEIDRHRELHAGRSSIPGHVRLHCYILHSALLI